MDKICSNVLLILDQFLIPSSEEKEEKEKTAFYHKIKGDYNRYIAETASIIDRKKAVKNSFDAYYAASGSAANLKQNPIQLEVALDFSVSCN